MAKRKQKISRNPTNSSAPPRQPYPAISVVIPMFNAEKYIADCLNSIIAQTFQNFEVIVVDDCSTDSSCSIVESYMPKFGGRLTLTCTKKNSGNGTEPRNIGLAYSRGEYLYFMDNDDALTPTALAELYTHAKNFDADVVQCEKYYPIIDELWNNADYRAKVKPYNYLTGEEILITEPLIWENNFEERIKFLIQCKLIWNYWVQLIRRNFILKNSIKMVGVLADDMIFTICELCSAERYVIVPNVIYFYRQRRDSLIHKSLDVPNYLSSQITMLKDGIRYLDTFLNDREFFLRRPDLKYALFNFSSGGKFEGFHNIYSKVPPHMLDEFLRKEFSNGDNTAFMAYIFNMFNFQHLQLNLTQKQMLEFQQFAEQAQARINELEEYAVQAQSRIAQLEDELKNCKTE